MTLKTLTIRDDYNLLNEFKQITVINNTTQAQEIRKFIQDYVDTHSHLIKRDSDNENTKQQSLMLSEHTSAATTGQSDNTGYEAKARDNTVRF